MHRPNSSAHNSAYTIRNIDLADHAQVAELFESVRFELALRGLDLWQHGYPDEVAQRRDIESGTMHGLFRGDLLLAVVTLDGSQAPQYAQVNWEIRDARPLIIHRLATRASEQGKGHGDRMLAFCEGFAQRIGAKAIRLDTYAVNQRNMRFYEKRGYSKAAEHIYFLPQSSPFACFEKAVGAATD